MTYDVIRNGRTTLSTRIKALALLLGRRKGALVTERALYEPLASSLYMHTADGWYKQPIIIN